MPIIKLFLDRTHYRAEDVLENKMIHQGYTNKNCLLTTKDGSFIVRMPLKPHDFQNEFNAYQTYQKIKFHEFDVQTGVYIKPFINAHHPRLDNEETLKQVIAEIQKTHVLPVHQPIKEQDWFEWIEYNVLDSKILSYYYKTIKLVQDDSKTFTHHDLNEANILMTGQDVLLIDWEWARIDSPYFDFATLALNDNVDETVLITTAHLDEQWLNYYKFLVLVFSHMWCIYMGTNQTLKLKDEIFLKIKAMIPKIL